MEPRHCPSAWYDMTNSHYAHHSINLNLHEQQIHRAGMTIMRE